MIVDVAEIAKKHPRMPWLIGEINPYKKRGEDDAHKFDLYPLPEGASGHRLCKLILDMDMTTYLRSFVRRDLLVDKWRVPAARAAARTVLIESGSAPLVLLGSKVCQAFGVTYESGVFTSGDRPTAFGVRKMVIIPHPSGLCLAWNEPGAYERARNLIMPLVAEIRGAA